MKQPTPHLLVTITRAAGAPAQPDKKALTELFLHAWNVARRRSETTCRRLAVDVHIVGDARIAALSVVHLKQPGPTDVLAFPMGEMDPEREAHHLGEVVANYVAAEREAAARRIPATKELERYCVHGFLHLLGYEDKTPAQRRAMFVVQEKALR